VGREEKRGLGPRAQAEKAFDLLDREKAGSLPLDVFDNLQLLSFPHNSGFKPGAVQQCTREGGEGMRCR